MTINETPHKTPNTLPRMDQVMTPTFLIPCKIERGGFSTERLFTIELPDGPKTFAGYYEHFLNADRQKLDLETPAEGELMEGFAKCRIIQRQDDGALIIDIPSSDSLLVQPENLVQV
jgi:hypothetical protein